MTLIITTLVLAHLKCLVQVAGQTKEIQEMGEFFLALNVRETIAAFPCMTGKALQVLVDHK